MKEKEDVALFQSFPKCPTLPHCPSGVGRAQSSVPPALTIVSFPVSRVLPRQPFCLFCVQAVRAAGLGTFAVVQEQLHGKQEALVVRRPAFQLDIDELWLEEL